MTILLAEQEEAKTQFTVVSVKMPMQMFLSAPYAQIATMTTSGLSTVDPIPIGEED